MPLRLLRWVWAPAPSSASRRPPSVQSHNPQRRSHWRRTGPIATPAASRRRGRLLTYIGKDEWLFGSENYVSYAQSCCMTFNNLLSHWYWMWQYTKVLVNLQDQHLITKVITGMFVIIIIISTLHKILICKLQFCCLHILQSYWVLLISLLELQYTKKLRSIYDVVAVRTTHNIINIIIPCPQLIQVKIDAFG